VVSLAVETTEALARTGEEGQIIADLTGDEPSRVIGAAPMPMPALCGRDGTSPATRVMSTRPVICSSLGGSTT
jgi:hypothetical protein